ncbi:MAG: glycosyltransferase, partial [Nitrospinae bacterium]|nr:glycosyltransferase [Nitrospinota bacterium]
MGHPSVDIRKMRLGELLVHRGLITPERLNEALQLQKMWGTRLGDVLLAKGWVKSFDLCKVFADYYDMPVANLMKFPPDRSLLEKDRYDDYLTRLYIPWRKEGNGIAVAVADPTDELLDELWERYGDGISFYVTSKFDIIWELQNVSREAFSEEAVFGLFQRHPRFSAIEVATVLQLLAGFGVVVGLFAALYWSFTVTLIAINTFFAFFLTATFLFKIYLYFIGSDRTIDISVSQAEIDSLRNEDLPVYTVLVPMFREPEVLPILAAALRKMDYPLSKLDVKLVLEEDDEITINAAKELNLEATFEIIRVPASQPRTKPKACNYALRFARGEYVTIYDAEDKPEPDQLKKVMAAFNKAAPEVVCIQAKLNYFNADENWITRLFTLEYTMWFDFFIAALDRLRIPIPLGGTSNHFKTKILKDMGVWDPFNVTEDADLGLRITQNGYKVATVPSTTYEEANTALGNWIRQRSRWLKGYMQTYLVHMRNPVRTYRMLGGRGFWGFQLFIGGTILSALSGPLLWAMFIYWLFTGTHAFDDYFPPVILYTSLFNLLFGNGYLVYLAALSSFRRRRYELLWTSFLMPFYWMMMSFAAYKGLWQLLYNPFYWEKTVHGLSKFTQVERQQALE